MTDPDEGWKELRVRLEASYHQKLVVLKLLKQKTMSDAIHEALDHYFALVMPPPSPPTADVDADEETA